MGRAGPVGLGMTAGVPLFVDHLPPPSLLLAAALIALAAGLLWSRSWLPPLAVGLALGGLSIHSVPPGPRLRGPVALVGAVSSAATGTVADVAVSRARAIGGPWHEVSGRVRVRFPSASFLVPGVPVVVIGEGRAIQAHGPPGAPDAVVWARMSRIDSSVDAWEARRLGGDPAPPARQVPGLLRAIALGDRSEVDPEMLQAMRDTGTAHLLAVSGSNVALAAMVLVVLVRTSLGFVALRRPQGLAGPWLAAAAIVGAVAFSWFVGLPTSAQRAMVGAVAVAAASALGRSIDPPDVMGIAAIGMIVADPGTVATASFHLSFGAVIGLYTWGKAMDAQIPERWSAWITAPLRLLAASGAATIGTLSASAWWFQSLAPLGVLANLFAVPWTTFVLTPCAFAALLAPELIAGPAMTIGVAATEVQRAVLLPLAVPPWTPATGPVGALALCGVLLLARRPVLAAVLVGAVLRWPRPAPDGLRVTLFDVGQGMSVLAEWPDGERWLIDGGPPRGDIVAGLRRAGVRHLDRVIITHSDLDHVGGLQKVIDALSVEAIHGGSREGLEAVLAAAERHHTPFIDDATTRLHPPADFEGEGNDGSVVLTLNADGACRMLITGDASTAVEQGIVGTLPHCDALQVGHHGSKTSTSPALLQAVAPSLALIPVGLDNGYGHPTEGVLTRLEEVGARVLRTDVHGTIELTWSPDGLRARAHRYGEGWTPLPL